MKIQEEEVLTLLSGSENNSISNIKLTITMHTALIFKEQVKVKETRMKRKGLSPTSLLNTTYWRVWSSLLQTKDLHSSIIVKINKEYCPGTMNIYFIRSRLEQKKTIRNAMTWPGLTKDVEHWLFMFHLSSISNDKEGA
jgi:Ulp1 family protease